MPADLELLVADTPTARDRTIARTTANVTQFRNFFIVNWPSLIMRHSWKRTFGHDQSHGEKIVYMALHISPSGITCFPKIGTTFLTPSQYQKFCNMSTANRKIFAISELLTNLHTSEPVQRLWIWAYCEWRTDEFWQLHNILTVRGKIRMIAADLRAKGNPL